MWCFIVWGWNCSVSSNWWTVSTCGLCLLQIDPRSAKLLPVRKGGFQHYFWIKKIPTVFVWSSLHDLNGSPTFADSPGSPETCPCSCRSLTSKVGSYPSFVQLQNWVPWDCSTCRCRQHESASLTSDMVTQMWKCWVLLLGYWGCNVTSQMIKKETQVDPVLSKVYNYIISGWPSVVDPTLVPFKTKRDELSTRQGCILWGARVIVPPSLQEKVLQELHDTHPGISRMKALARSYVWWPSIDSHWNN